MFTGIILDVGSIINLKKDKGDLSIIIQTKLPIGKLKVGDSVCCSGICLTVINKFKSFIEVELSKETLSVSTSKYWDISQSLNLELSTALGESMGGHIVTGHIDGIAKLLKKTDIDGSTKMIFDIPLGLKKFIAKKGSITIDGVSLTVNEVSSETFEVNLISYTNVHTTLGSIKIGNEVNIEVDIIARYTVNALENNVKRN